MCDFWCFMWFLNWVYVFEAGRKKTAKQRKCLDLLEVDLMLTSLERFIIRMFINHLKLFLALLEHELARKCNKQCALASGWEVRST